MFENSDDFAPSFGVSVSYSTSSNRLDEVHTPGATHVPVSSLSPSKVKLLDNSITIPKFYTEIVGYEINKDFISYVIEYGIIQPGNDTVQLTKAYTRYSKLLDLYDTIKSIYPLVASRLPAFPPKQWFNNVSRKTADYRFSAMKPFIQMLNSIPSVSKLKPFDDIFNKH